MEWLDDSKACLEVARAMLDVIERQINASIQQEKIPPSLNVTIKNLLENCRSPLDYGANYIFEAFCKEEYASNNEIKNKGASKPQFPITTKPDVFEKNMENKFKNLKSNYPNVYEEIKKVQPFNGELWLNQLTLLVNANKHHSFTPQTRTKHEHIRTFDTETGRILSSFPKGAIHVENSTNVFIGGMPWDQINQVPLPTQDRGYEISTWVDIIFTDIKSPVLPTLTKIYDGVYSVINNLEIAIEGN